MPGRWTKKQLEIIKCIKHENPKILICYGAMRAGKTYVLSTAYLGHIAKFEGENRKFIIGGATYANIWRNILYDWEELLGIKIKLHKDNSFDLFGNKIYVFGGDNASSWKAVKGFSAAGAFLNEATALHDTFIKECIARCSDKGSVIYMDTNPDNPTHYVKTDYIDKSGTRFKNGKLNIQAFHFTLFDNEFLDKEYVESIINATPSGMYTDRNIYGKWVSPEGVVYQDFDVNKHVIPLQSIPKDIKWLRFWGGVDWGYQHKGSITIFGMDTDHNIYMIEEHTKQYKEIDYWVKVAKDFISKYGNIQFFADSARPEHVARFNREGIKCINANKKVLAGIEVVSKLLKVRKLFFIKENIDKILEEFNLYVWNETTGEPVKQNDDVLDSLRYAIYSLYVLYPKLFKCIEAE